MKLLKRKNQYLPTALSLFYTSLFFAIVGMVIMYLTDYDELGNALLVSSGTLFVIVLAVTSNLVISESKRERRRAERLASFSNKRKKFLSEGEEFHRKQEEMNLEEWNKNDFTEPSIDGRGSHEP